MALLQSERTIIINGRRLYASVLCQRVDNPIMLFIHGGPGYGTSYGLSRIFLGHCPRLVEKVTMIFWDQRCAGQSFSLTDLFQSSTIEDYLSDVRSVIRYFLDLYGQDKLIIAGHSWGSILGFKAATRWPELTLGYVGMGQVVDGLAGERISYRYSLRKTLGKRKDLYDSVSKFGPPPHEGRDVVSYLLTQRRVLTTMGGFQRSPVLAPIPRHNTSLGRLLFRAKTNMTMYLSLKRLWTDCLATNLRSVPWNLPFPVLFVCGRYDFITPTSLVIALYRGIRSRKKITIFDKSGHRPHLEEIGRFADLIAQELGYLRSQCDQYAVDPIDNPGRVATSSAVGNRHL